MAILSIKNLNFTYINASSKTLDNINLEVNQGEFVVICGESGCGKSTLVRLVKKELSPNGNKTGEIYYNDISIDELDERVSSSEIGFVMQKPENQIVTDRVYHELAFGLENLGFEKSIIKRKIAETASFFGINTWYHKNTSELSGGEKQLLNLASIMVMKPKILILDEPTSQLDPIAATEFINTLKKINTELGITIILVEHRLEDVFPIADKVVVMNKSEILMVSSPREVGMDLSKNYPNHKMVLALPSAVRIFSKFDIETVCPITITEGQIFLKDNFKNDINILPTNVSDNISLEVAIEIKDGFFRYEKSSNDVLNGLNLKIYKGEIFSILGGNGVGKTTVLKIINHTLQMYRGKLKIWSKDVKKYNEISLYRNNIATLPQNPEVLFVRNSVYDDLMEAIKLMNYSQDVARYLIKEVSESLEVTDLINLHPFDLSVGEQQRVAIAKLLIMKPKIILLDEPTKGLDAYSKQNLSKILKKLREKGVTIIIVTHDIEFAALHSDRCALLFDGEIVSSDVPNVFFSENDYYTTAASRISRGLFVNTITCEQVIELCKINGER